VQLTALRKGRVERAHLTLQDRLVKELRLRGISTIDAANAYVPAFIASYNARFAKPPKSAFDAHRPLRADENLDFWLSNTGCLAVGSATSMRRCSHPQSSSLA
jgi:hypothetical protein